MKQIFIDEFVVPSNSVETFLARMEYNRAFISKLSGFIKDNVYQRFDENGNIIYITIAEWQDETSLTQAKIAVLAEYKRINFDPQKMMTNLGIDMKRGIFTEIISK
ncbi:MAG: antibiotic biosynthesis monooxygenase [Thalassobius sp.]|nr:antibiotic biosynthesis monooxygenase [Thalassovita sp.]